MPDVVSHDDLNALAAEYVLGTLDYEERKGATALLEVDSDFLAMVRIWERRFGELHLMVESVEPDPQIFARIKPQLANVAQVAIAISSQEAERARVVPPPMAPPPMAPPVVLAAAAAAAPVTHAAAEVVEQSPVATGRGPAVAEPSPTIDEVSSVKVEPSGQVADPSPAVESGPSIGSSPVEVVGSAPAAEEASPIEAVAPVADQTAAAARPTVDETSPAIAQAELKLAELAALLPVPGAAGPQTAEEPSPQPEPQAPDQSPPPPAAPAESEFVPPVPMVARGAPVLMRAPPVRAGGRGWMAATLTLGVVTLVLGGLIGAWRFFPDRLPAELRADALLGLSAPPPPPQTQARPALAPFDE